MADLVSVVSPDAPRRPGWDEYSGLVNKLRSLLPKPLTHTELSGLDPRHQSSQAVSTLIFEELATATQTLIAIQSSLESLNGFLTGVLPYTPHYQTLLLSLVRDSVPVAWRGSLALDQGYPSALVPAVQLLRDRHSLYVNMLQSGAMPAVISTGCLSQPQDLLSRALYQYSSEEAVEPSAINTLAQVNSHQSTLCMYYIDPR